MGFESKFLKDYSNGNKFDIVLLYVYAEYSFCCFLPQQSANSENFVSVISAFIMDTIFENLKEEPVDEEEVDRKPASGLVNSCSEEDQPARYAPFFFYFCIYFCIKSLIKCRILIKIYRVCYKKVNARFSFNLHLFLYKSLIKC
jgi:hypothetical protein